MSLLEALAEFKVYTFYIYGACKLIPVHQIIVTTMLRHFVFEDAGVVFDWYHLGGNTVKPKIRGREAAGVQLPLRVREI